MSVAAPALNPCRHMRGLVNRMADGSLSGALLRYAKMHVGGCARCRQALEVLRATLSRLRVLSEPSPVLPEQNWIAIENAWIDHEQTDPPDEIG